MEKVINILSNPFIWGIVIFIAGFAVKKKLSTYLRLLRLLIDAVEIIDRDIKDIVSDEVQAKLIKIKQWIDSRLSKQEKKIIDAELKTKGYLGKIS